MFYHRDLLQAWGGPREVRCHEPRPPRGWGVAKQSVDGASLGKDCSVGEGRTRGTSCYCHCLRLGCQMK